MLFVCCAIWMLGQYRDNESRSYKRFQDIIPIVAGIMLNNIPSQIPKTFRLRYVFVLWLFFCLNWTSAYTSSLITMITTAQQTNDKVISVLILINLHGKCNDFNSQIHTVADILNSGLTPIGSSAFNSHLASLREYDSITYTIRERFEVCSIQKCLTRVANSR